MHRKIRNMFVLFLIPLLFSRLLFSMNNEDYTNWWSYYRSYEKLPLELRAMEDYFINSGSIRYSSNFWNFLNFLNIQQISDKGYENFKQTVCRNYFTWVTQEDHAYVRSIKGQVPQLIVLLPAEEIERIHPFFTPEESMQFNELTMYFLNYMLNIGAGPYLEKLEEPLIGNPPYITYQGRRVSQDIFNSLTEYMPISGHCPLDQISTIIEVGAGSGRTAFVFITLSPHVKYAIVDFPPALYLSQTYLTAVFPDKKIMKFRPFSRFEDVADEFDAADIVFLMPDQLEMLPDRSGDLFLAIDCLHEMKPDRIAHYFNESARLCSYMYFKCWQQTTVPFDECSYSMESYPVPVDWKVLFKEPCVVPNDFFHAFYKIENAQ